MEFSRLIDDNKSLQLFCETFVDDISSYTRGCLTPEECQNLTAGIYAAEQDPIIRRFIETLLGVSIEEWIEEYKEQLNNA